MPSRDEFTPTTEEMRVAYCSDWSEGGSAATPFTRSAWAAEFDRWLADAKREAATKAVRSAADAMPIDLWATYGRMPRGGVLEVQKWLRQRADELKGSTDD